MQEMPTVTSTATYRRLLDKLPSIEAKLSPRQRSTFHTLLETDERALLNALLEMADHHPNPDFNGPRWRYMRPQLEGN
jgi:hypothetical protein